MITMRRICCAEMSVLMFCLTAVGACQEIGPGTPLTIQLDAKVPMRVEQALNGHLLHPVFQDNHLPRRYPVKLNPD